MGGLFKRGCYEYDAYDAYDATYLHYRLIDWEHAG